VDDGHITGLLGCQGLLGLCHRGLQVGNRVIGELSRVVFSVGMTDYRGSPPKLRRSPEGSRFGPDHASGIGKTKTVLPHHGPRTWHPARSTGPPTQDDVSRTSL